MHTSFAFLLATMCVWDLRTCLIVGVFYLSSSPASNIIRFCFRNRKLKIHRPQNEVTGNSLFKRKSIGSWSDPEDQTASWLWWMMFGVDTGMEVGEEDESG